MSTAIQAVNQEKKSCTPQNTFSFVKIHSNTRLMPPVLNGHTIIPEPICFLLYFVLKSILIANEIKSVKIIFGKHLSSS